MKWSNEPYGLEQFAHELANIVIVALILATMLLGVLWVVQR